MEIDPLKEVKKELVKEEMWKKILGMGKCDFCDEPATYETQKGEYEDYPEDFYYRVTSKEQLKFCDHCKHELEYELGNVKEFKKSKFSKFFRVKNLGEE